MRDDGKEVRESQPWSPPPNGRKNPCQGPPRSLSNGVWTQASCQRCQHQRGQVLMVSQTHRTQWKLRGVRVRLRESRPEGARGWKNNAITGQISGLMKTWRLCGVEEGLGSRARGCSGILEQMLFKKLLWPHSCTLAIRVAILTFAL